MKKWILIGGGVIVLIVIAGIILLASNLGPMIKTAVNTYGPDITKTDVRLGEVGISLFSAQAEIKDFLLGNPRGFNSPHAIKVGSIIVDVDEKSLTGDTIIIDRIEVVAPDISYEKSGRSDNFQTILSNVNKTIGTAEKKAGKKSGEKEPGKKLLIRDFVVKDGQVNLSMALLAGQTISANLPDIHLKNIGNKKGGASPAEAFDEIFKALYAQINSPAVTKSLDQGLKAIGKSLDAIAKDPVKGIEQTQKELETVGKGAEKDVKAITDTVKGLFGK
jgi:uncharacterized protein involved in outer membrane biogenesis